MHARSWGYLLAACLCMTAACGGGGAPVQSPRTLAASADLAQTEQVILDVLPRRGWTAESVQPQRIVAFLAVRKHLLRVEIRYDAQQVAIYYVDSDNLAAHVESDGQVYAHKRVNAWIQILATDIGAGLAAAAQPASAGGAAPGAAAPTTPAPTTPSPASSATPGVPPPASTAPAAAPQ